MTRSKLDQGVGLAAGSAASPFVGVAVGLGVAVGSSWLLMPGMLISPIGCPGSEIVPNMLVIGRLLRNLLGIQRSPTIPSQ